MHLRYRFQWLWTLPSDNSVAIAKACSMLVATDRRGGMLVATDRRGGMRWRLRMLTTPLEHWCAAAACWVRTELRINVSTRLDRRAGSGGRAQRRPPERPSAGGHARWRGRTWPVRCRVRWPHKCVEGRQGGQWRAMGRSVWCSMSGARGGRCTRG